MAEIKRQQNLAKVGNKISKPGDVVFTSKVTVGRFALVGANTPRFVYSPQLCFWRSLDQKKLLPEYLYYWMNSQEFLNQIGYLKGQTDMADYVSLRDQRKITATIPSTDVQQLVVAVLKQIDDRISLLRETNTTLEAIVQALFKSWFVDFDPVRAKQLGHEPEGMDFTTATLFPDSFEESELGLVPKGWRVGSLGDEVSIAYGKNLPTKNLLEFGYPVFGGNGRIGYFNRYLYKERQVLISCRGAASGKVNQSLPKSFVTNNSLVLETDSNSDLEFCYLKGYMLRTDLSPFVTGSAQPQVTIDNLKNFRILVPPTSIIREYQNLGVTIEEKIDANERQAQTLATLRDTLLPRLISGQLRLPNAAEMVTNAYRNLIWH